MSQTSPIPHGPAAARTSSSAALLVVLLCLCAVLFLAWAMSAGIHSGPVQDKASPVNSSPVPWIADGSQVYVPAVMAFRIDRDDLNRWPIPFSRLNCSNTRWCAYGIPECEALHVRWTTDTTVNLESADGVTFSVEGALTDWLFPAGGACRKRVGKSTFYFDDHGDRRFNLASRARRP